MESPLATEDLPRSLRPRPRPRPCLSRAARPGATRRWALGLAVALALGACRGPSSNRGLDPARDADAPGAVDPGGTRPLEAPIRVLLLGDSISIGYTEAVRALLGEAAVVVRPTLENGRPENCAGTTKGVEHVGRWVELEGGDWDVVHANFGLHDLKHVDPASGANSNDPDAPPQADLATYRAQLRTIVARLDATGARLVLATTTPVPEGGVRPFRDPADVARYNAALREVAAEYGALVDDLHAVVVERLPELQRPVDVHFTQAGSQVLAEAVARAVREAAGWGSAPR